MYKIILFISIQLFYIFTEQFFLFADNNINKRKIILNDSMDKYSIGLFSDYLEDKDKNLKIEDILINDRDRTDKLQWIRSETETLAFGMVSSSYWIRFTAANPGKNEIKWAIEVDYPHIDLIELYTTINNSIEVRKAGDSFPFKMRELEYRNCIFNLVQEPETEATYYMRFETSSSMNISLWIWSPDLLASKVSKESIIFGLYFGILLITGLYSLFSFFSMREKLYLYYFLWIAGYGLYQISINGLSFQYFWPESPGWENFSIPFFVFFGCIWCLQFARELLNTKNNLPFFDRLIRIFLLLSAMCMIFTFILPYSIIIRASALAVMIVVLFLQITGIVSLYYRILFANYYVISWTALFLGGFAFAFKSLGFLPDNFLTNYSQQIGSALQIILLSFAFADYVNKMNKEIQEAQKSTIDAFRSTSQQKDEFLEQTAKKNIEIENLNLELKKHIQDLNEANKRISLSEEKYRILVEGTDEIIFSMDEDFRFLTVNKAISTYLNLKPEDIISKIFFELIHEENGEADVSKQLLHEKLDFFIKDKKPISFKADFKSSFSSEPKEVSVRLECLNIGGRDEIIGRAVRVEDDVLMKYIEFEKQRLIIGNYFITAEDISYRITRNLAKYIDQRQVHLLRIAVREILINAIEHGNLNISFEEKSKLMDNDDYFEFLTARQKDPRYLDRRIRIEYSIDAQKAVYKITDEGDGFDHRSIMRGGGVDVNEEMLAHGRGIQMAKNCFDEIIYNNKGNQVMLKKYYY